MSNSFVEVKKSDNPYTMIKTSFLHDNRLKWQHKGLLAYLLSMPNGWTLNVDDLIPASKDGRDAVYSTLKALKELGYIEYIRVRNAKGHIVEHRYIVHEEPVIPDMDEPHLENPEVDEKPLTENPEMAPFTENPQVDKTPYTENPDVENSILSIKDLVKEKDLVVDINTNNNRDLMALFYAKTQDTKVDADMLSGAIDDLVTIYGDDAVRHAIEYTAKLKPYRKNALATLRFVLKHGAWKEVAAAAEQPERKTTSAGPIRDERYAAFYRLFPDA